MPHSPCENRTPSSTTYGLVRGPRACLLWLLLATVSGAPCLAQDFSIYTKLYDLRQSPGTRTTGAKTRPQPVGETFSVFHAGKVYDYLQQIDEMTIFEPAQRRFTIISNSRKLATSLSFAEIENVLYRSEMVARKNIELKTDAQGQQMIERVRFLLEPAFKRAYNTKTHELRLTSPSLKYRVVCEEGQVPERIEAYIRYADWAARLNFVLHPKSLLPSPRLALNAVLQEQHLLPVEVELMADTNKGAGIHMKAVHKYTWQLDTLDRRKITYWNALLEGQELKQVSFDEFQRALNAQADVGWSASDRSKR